ncbi:hypothetical protein HMPREF0591_0532 [Mycobacterium parascrofulaceum ATCC BAA-614]|uniref:Uncharacterized protein n=1 Tax=Mycobacterium parascrofulaceum ATCC BAA-614 TaxID=525368 RepID=D5P2Y8_9MYCO|nr:hypothetical protein HMPREF0591_0532 [Mycobacterium parascrofulaceum ATCC BAA-614]
MNRPPDQPTIHIAPNSSRPGLVVIAIGSGTNPYSITPEQADDLADQLTAAADAARSSAEPHGRP